ncbi:MAG: polysaccharide deacetylase family protein, partial [Acidimicrobiales bacterium]
SLSPSPTTPPTPTPKPVPATIGFTLHVPILVYHLVAPAGETGNALSGLVVSPEQFSAQMDVLAAGGWHTITAAELGADLAAKRTPPRKTFVVTLDDGYDNGYTYALPILRAHGFRATYYVVTGRVGSTSPAGPVLSVSHLQELLAAGMEIGNHTVNHVNLEGLSNADLVAEIDGASTMIAADVGQPPTTFAYPFGLSDQAAVTQVARGGFSLAVTTAYGCTESYGYRYQAPRFHVGPGTTPAYLLSLIAPCDG